MDLVGSIIEIGKEQEKTRKKSGEKRVLSYMRVMTKGKPVSVSFWGENSDALHNMLLMEREPVILTDLSLKQGYLEFTSDSCVTRLNDDREIFLRHPEYQEMTKYEEKEKALVTLKEFSGLKDKTTANV